MGQLSISDISFWENYKQKVFLVIREALAILVQKTNLPEVEQSTQKKHSLNRELYKCIRSVCNHDAALIYHLPVYEGKNPPGQSVTPADSESKIPDFYWHISNHLADDDEAELRFVVECKRLGSPSSSDWIFNENYVLNGIYRFLTDSHEYGKGDEEGGMIGYVQSMTFADILKDVNQAICQSPISITEVLSPADGWVENGISELEQVLERPFPISPFRLFHFWVDIRRD